MTKKSVRLYKCITPRADEAINSYRDSAIDLVQDSALYFEITLPWFLCHRFKLVILDNLFSSKTIATLSFHFFSKKITSKCHQSLGCYFKPC